MDIQPSCDNSFTMHVCGKTLNHMPKLDPTFTFQWYISETGHQYFITGKAFSNQLEARCCDHSWRTDFFEDSNAK